MDFTKVDKLIDDSYEQMVADLATIIQFPSVSEMEGGDAPFGENVSDCKLAPFGENVSDCKPAPFGENVSATLDAILAICEREGLSIKNANGLYGYADFNGDKEDAELVGILGHMDVVPAQRETWTYEPFELTRVTDSEDAGQLLSGKSDVLRTDLARQASNEKLFGRGTIDDKGPMLAALYGLLALKEVGEAERKTAGSFDNAPADGLLKTAGSFDIDNTFNPTKRLRFIFGTNEEVAMLGVKEYVKREELPARGFTPDADWPIIIGEKGILQFSLSASWANEPAGEEASASNAKQEHDNACTYALTPADLPRLVSMTAGTVSNAVPASAVATFSDGNVIKTNGTTAHGSTPQLGDNALTKLLYKLSQMDFAPAEAKAFVDELARIFTTDDTRGTTLGLAGSDDVSENTAAPTIFKLDENGGELTVDLRFNLSDRVEKYETILQSLASEKGWSFEAVHKENPIYTKPDTSIVRDLLDAYMEVTGDVGAEPLIIGGGTYAKVMPGFVAFGMEPKDGPMRAHQSDEYITKQEFLTATKIYARAIYKLIK